MGRVFPPPGGSGDGWPPLGVDVPSVSGAHSTEYALCAAGPNGRTIVGFWVGVVDDASGITASDTNGLQFTVNCRAANGTISTADYVTTATTGSGGLGNVPLLGVVNYTFPSPLACPANGLITIAVESYGSGVNVGGLKMGVHFQ